MSEQKNQRPVPKANRFVETEAFWQGTKQGELLLQYCPDTKQFQHYPRPISVYTGKRNLEWRKVSGQGVIYACTIVRVPGPGLDDRLPLSVVTVELDEGVRILGNVLNAAPDKVAIGQRVELAWDALGDDAQYPGFNLVEA
ncbi:MAG: Zn-ribbon domain-containing OB-fold protein [Alphaproteobacteria bacterium]|nr:Zn-ribbon domain-containing OB-fold protein [Alphaproteobacteria bacterium]